VVVTRNGREVAQLKPEKRMYRVQQNPMTEAAIRSTHLRRSVYVSLGQSAGGSAWVVRVYYKPFVTWIWGGCVLMAHRRRDRAGRPALPAVGAARGQRTGRKGSSSVSDTTNTGTGERWPRLNRQARRGS
jgi:hypothetical protein